MPDQFGMNYCNQISRTLSLTGICISATLVLAQTTPSASAAADKPYKVVNTVQVMGTGPIDYVYADNDGRRLYVPRGNPILVFDLDTLKSVGSISSASRARGVAVDPKSHHGFCSSSPALQARMVLASNPVRATPRVASSRIPS